MESFSSYAAAEWRNLSSCLLMIVFTSGYLSSTGVVLILIQETFGVSREEASIPLATGNLFYFALGLISGPMLHVLKIRRALFLCVAISALGSLLSFFNPTFFPEIVWISFCYALKGCGSTHILSLCLQHLTTDADTHRAKVFFLVLMSYSICTMVFPLVFAAWAAFYGLRGAWLLEGALFVQAFVFVLVVKVKKTKLKTTKQIVETEEMTRGKLLESEKPEFKSENSSLANYAKDIWQLLKKPHFYVIMLFNSCAITTFVTFTTVLVDYSRDRQLAEYLTLTIMTVVFATDFIGRILVTALVDKGVIPSLRIGWIIFLTTSTLFFCLAFSYKIFFLIVALLLGVCFGGTGIIYMVLLPSLGKSNVAFINGTSKCICGFLLLLLPTLIGYFRDFLGDYKYLAFILSAFNFVCALIMASYEIKTNI